MDKKPRKVRKDKGVKRGSLKDQRFMKEMEPYFGPFNPTLPIVHNTKQQEQAFMDEMEQKYFKTEPKAKAKVVRVQSPKAKLVKAITNWFHKNADEDQLAGDPVGDDKFPQKITSSIQNYRPKDLISGPEKLNKNITIDYHPGSSPAGLFHVVFTN